MSPSQIASELGKLAKGCKKTMSPAAIAHRQRISALGVAARAAKRKTKSSNNQD